MKKDWTLSHGAFREFLNWLDHGVDSGGERYLEMRRRLALYFDRKNCLSPDELADETLNRVARKLEEKGSITDLSPAHYCYVVAKFVFLESLRRLEHSQTNFDELTHSTRLPSRLLPSGTDEALVAREKLHDCLEECLNRLPRKDRDLIVGYYKGEQRAKIEARSQIAAALGVTLNALSIRACRIRDKLEACVRKCCGET